MPIKFVSVGDSLTQGFQSGSISRTEWSYPAMIARAMKLTVDTTSDAKFRIPDFEGADGLPVNLEALFNTLGKHYGSKIRFWEIAPALTSLGHFLAETEDYWER